MKNIGTPLDNKIRRLEKIIAHEEKLEKRMPIFSQRAHNKRYIISQLKQKLEELLKLK